MTDEVIRLVWERARAMPGLGGLLLVGSAARNEMQPNSDWDFIALFDVGAPWPKPFRDGGRETFPAPDGRQVEVAYSTISRVRERIAEQAPLGICAYAEMIAEGRQVDEPSPAVAELQEYTRRILAAGPPPIPEHDLKWRCYEIWNQHKDAADCLNDPMTSLYLSNLALWSMTRLLIRLNGSWLPRPKVVYAEVERLDPQFRQLCERFASAHGARERYDVLTEMIEHLRSRFGLDFEAYYTSPPAAEESPGG